MFMRFLLNLLQPIRSCNPFLVNAIVPAVIFHLAQKVIQPVDETSGGECNIQPHNRLWDCKCDICSNAIPGEGIYRTLYFECCGKEYTKNNTKSTEQISIRS